MKTAALWRASLGLVGLGLVASCMAGGPAADDGVAVRPPPPTTPEEHSEQLALVDKALQRDPMNSDYRKWAEDLNAISDAWAGLFYSFKTDQGSTVKLYEPQPGVYMVAERGPHGVDLSVGHLVWESAGELYAQLKPGAPVPAEIAAADERRSAVIANLPGSTVLDGEPETGSVDPGSSQDASSEYVDKHAGSCADFRDTHRYCPTGTAGNWCVCDLQSDATGSRDNMTHSYHRISVVRGNVSANFQIGSAPMQGWALLQGEEWWFSFYSPFGGCANDWIGEPVCHGYAKRRHWGQIVNAAGDDYHWGACFESAEWANTWTCTR